MIKIRAAVIIEKNGEILLAKHKKKNNEYWVIPGGTLEEGETLEEAAIREIQEESGYTVKIHNLVFVSEVIKPSGSKHIIDFFFRGSIISGVLKKGPDHFLSDIRFLPINNIDKITFYPHIKNELKKALANNFTGGGIYLGNRNLADGIQL
jgi:8-oxo-dGTP diphosphatase